jgi:protein-S-isoprenylcysteine O-methyltransferase Ste14
MLRFFELKVPPPLTAAVVAILMAAWSWGNHLSIHPSMLRRLTVLVFLGMGVYVIVGAIQNLQHSKTTLSFVNPSSTTRLVTEGAYSWSRNPMYLGLLIVLMAFARAFDSLALWLGPLLFFAFVGRFQIHPEEQALMEKFGEEYSQYKSKVRRWV